jgi:hypothetical protein
MSGANIVADPIDVETPAGPGQRGRPSGRFSPWSTFSVCSLLSVTS